MEVTASMATWPDSFSRRRLESIGPRSLHTWSEMRRSLFTAALTAMLAAARAAAAEDPPGLPFDPYDDAMTRSTAAEARGDLESAARALEAALPAYPQDYAIAIRVAWLRFRA